MHDNSTLNKLILYYFNETNLPETVLTQLAIDGDVEVEEEFQTIVKTMEFIDQSLVNPSQSSIEKILNFSKSFQKS
jgi:hypothetical protein